jgi:hypothetical protein
MLIRQTHCHQVHAEFVRDNTLSEKDLLLWGQRLSEEAKLLDL